MYCTVVLYYTYHRHSGTSEFCSQFSVSGSSCLVSTLCTWELLKVQRGLICSSVCCSTQTKSHSLPPTHILYTPLPSPQSCTKYRCTSHDCMYCSVVWLLFILPMLWVHSYHFYEWQDAAVLKVYHLTPLQSLAQWRKFQWGLSDDCCRIILSLLMYPPILSLYTVDANLCGFDCLFCTYCWFYVLKLIPCNNSANYNNCSRNHMNNCHIATN